MPKKKLGEKQQQQSPQQQQQQQLLIHQNEFSQQQQQLPQGWDVGRDYDGKIYFIDHNTKKTTWVDPRGGEGGVAAPAAAADR